MASYSTSPSSWRGLGGLFAGLAKTSCGQSNPKPTASELRAEREFINEMIWNHPDAFSSELDIQTMMSVFPNRF